MRRAIALIFTLTGFLFALPGLALVVLGGAIKGDFE